MTPCLRDAQVYHRLVGMASVTNLLDLPMEVLHRIMEMVAGESDEGDSGVSVQVSLFRLHLVCKTVRQALLEAPFLSWEFTAAVDELRFHEHILSRLGQARALRVTLVVKHPVNLRSVLQTIVMSLWDSLEEFHVLLVADASFEDPEFAGANVENADPFLWHLLFKMLHKCESLKDIDLVGLGVASPNSSIDISGLNPLGPFVHLATLRLQGFLLPAITLERLLQAMPVLRVLEIEVLPCQRGGFVELKSESLIELVWVEELSAVTASRQETTLNIRCGSLRMLTIESWAPTVTSLGLFCSSLEELRIQTLPLQGQQLAVVGDLPCLQDARIIGRSWCNIASVLLASSQLQKLSIHEPIDFPPVEQVLTFCNAAGVCYLTLGSTVRVFKDGSSDVNIGRSSTLTRVTLWVGPDDIVLELHRLEALLQVCGGLQSLVVVYPYGMNKSFRVLISEGKSLGCKYGHCQLQFEN